MEQPNFTKGSLIISTTGVNVRIQPASTVAFTAPPNTPATVIDGPVMVDDLPWYQIRGGWVARHNHVSALWEPLTERVQAMYADEAFMECVQVVLGIEGGLTTEEQAKIDRGGLTCRADIFDQTYEQTESPDTLFGFEVRTVDWKTSDAIIVCGPPYIGTEGG